MEKKIDATAEVRLIARSVMKIDSKSGLSGVLGVTEELKPKSRGMKIPQTVINLPLFPSRALLNSN